MEWPNLTLNFRSKGQLQDCQLLAFQKINSKQTNRQIERQTDRQKKFKFQVSKNYFIVDNVGSFENKYRGTRAKTISGGKAKILAGFCKGKIIIIIIIIIILLIIIILIIIIMVISKDNE